MEGKKDEEPGKRDEDNQEEVIPKESSKPAVSRSATASQNPSRTKTVPSAIQYEDQPAETHVDPEMVEQRIPDVTPSQAPSIKKHEMSSSKSKVLSHSSKTSHHPVPSREKGMDKSKSNLEAVLPPPDDLQTDSALKKKTSSRPEGLPVGLVGCLASGLPNFENFSCSKFFTKRSPYSHNPPLPEERRPRVDRPRCPRDYIINLREDLADFQESHGLPRTRDYSFMSLGLALAQETARAICSVFLMFSELIPVVAIISLVLRFALDKLIDILETNEPVPKLKKTLIFCLQMIMILIPLWILIGTIVLPLAGLLLSILRKLFRLKGGKPGRISCGQRPIKHRSPPAMKKIEPPKKKAIGSNSKDCRL